MQSRFGVKDFVIMVMILAVGIAVWLAMFQRDREWNELQELKHKLADVEKQLSRVGSKLESGAPSRAPDATATSAAGSRDESWARPGIPIAWQDPWSFATDPHAQPGFTEDGDFTEIYEAQFPKLTPIIQTDIYGRRITDMVVDALAAYDPKTLRLRGTLAEAWQLDPDGLWLRVKLNPRARFSDGEPVTAEDVRWTYHDFVMNQQIEATRERSTKDLWDKVTVISDRVVEFTFKEALALNLDEALTMKVLPKHFYSKFDPAAINTSTGLLLGSGPYKLEKLDPARQWNKPDPVVLVRNEQYWGPRSPLARIRIKAIDNELPRLTEYKNGLADMITPQAPQFASMDADPEWKKNNVDLNWVNMRSGKAGIIWNCGPRGGQGGKLTPFHDKRVRQAMTLILDRQKMVTDIWKGVGMVAKGYANPGTLGDIAEMKPWPCDPPRGAALLKEAGWQDRNGDRILEDKDGNQFKFELTTFGSGEISEKVGRFIKDTYASVGIIVTIRQMSWDVGETVRQQRDFDAMLMSWGSNAPESDPKQIFHSASIVGQGDNFAQWSDPAADAAIDAARRELDRGKREKLLQDFERVLYEGQPYTWVRVQPFLRFVKPHIKNVNTYPKGLEPWEYWSGGPMAPEAVK